MKHRFEASDIKSCLEVHEFGAKKNKGLFSVLDLYASCNIKTFIRNCHKRETTRSVCMRSFVRIPINSIMAICAQKLLTKKKKTKGDDAP